jgi:hypothetical protein
MTSPQIWIDHVGPIDKPIIPLIISVEKLTLPVTELLVQVDEKSFAFLVTYFESTEYLDPENKVNEFGVFKITRVVNGEPKISFTSTRSKSVHLFRDLLGQLNDKPPKDKLAKEINKILARIDFDGK